MHLWHMLVVQKLVLAEGQLGIKVWGLETHLRPTNSQPN